MINAVTVVLPGADADDNGPIGVGQLIETTPATRRSNRSEPAGDRRCQRTVKADEQCHRQQLGRV